jgi:hypothetical protein
MNNMKNNIIKNYFGFFIPFLLISLVNPIYEYYVLKTPMDSAVGSYEQGFLILISLAFFYCVLGVVSMYITGRIIKKLPSLISSIVAGIVTAIILVTISSWFYPWDVAAALLICILVPGIIMLLAKK